YPFGKVARPLTGPVKGMKFTIRPGMGFTYAIGKVAWNWRWLKERVPWKGATVYDIGANRGQMTLWFAKRVGRAGIRDYLLSKGYVVENLAGERVPDPTKTHDDPLWCFRERRYDHAV